MSNCATTCTFPTLNWYGGLHGFGSDICWYFRLRNLVFVQKLLQHWTRYPKHLVGALKSAFRAPKIYHAWVVFKAARNAFRRQL
jgi:hypothetical protein